MRVTYSPRAVADLTDIATYLAERSPVAAVAVEKRIRLLVELAAHFPASGRIVAERGAVRVIPLGKYPYRIFYTASDDELVILHVRHAAREPIDLDDL